MEQIELNTLEKVVLGLPEGTIFFASDFELTGRTKAALNKGLQRLCDKGVILRLGQGIYYLPKVDTELGLGVIYPTMDDVARAIAGRYHARIVPTGDTALNKLGLSTQVPANAVYLTDGSPRRVAVGNGKGILFKHTGEMKMLSYGSELLMLIVSAIRTIGDGKLTDEQKRILTEHLKHVSEEDLKRDMNLAPVWVQKVLKELWN